MVMTWKKRNLKHFKAKEFPLQVKCYPVLWFLKQAKYGCFNWIGKAKAILSFLNFPKWEPKIPKIQNFEGDRLKKIEVDREIAKDPVDLKVPHDVLVNKVDKCEL